MRSRPDMAALLGGLVLVALCALPLRAWAGCEKDTDCKGDRICSSGVCEDPGSAPAQPAPQYAPPPPSYAPPPSYVPPPYAPPPEYPPPGIYAPPPPPYAPPPRLFLPRESYATSYLALGGVGYLPTSGALGGVSLEHLWLVRLFRAPGVDGGLTFQLGADFAFDASDPNGLAFLNAGWFGMGFDFGSRFLQFGPRVAVGYAYGSAGYQTALDGIVLVGGHVNLWVTRAFGFYFEPDAVYDFSHPLWFPRLSGGLAFRW